MRIKSIPAAVVLCGAAFFPLAGCDTPLGRLLGELLSGVIITPETGEAALRAFESEEELRSYLVDQLERTVLPFGPSAGTIDDFAFDLADGLFPGAGTEPSPDIPVAAEGEAGAVSDESGSDAFSGTTIQEVGVDEADVVKTDGEFLYILTGEHLRIVRADRGDSLAEVGSVELGGFSRDLFLLDDLVIALTAPIFGGFDIEPGPTVIVDPVFPVDDADEEEAAIDPSASDDDDKSDGDGKSDGEDDNTVITIARDQLVPGVSLFRPRIEVVFIDVRDRSNPNVISSTVFDGSLASSRVIDKRLHLVLANPADVLQRAMPGGGRPDTFSEFALEFFLPGFVSGPAKDAQTKTGTVVDWPQVYRPADPDGAGMVTIVTIDSRTPDQFDAVAVVADPGLVYASTSAIYLTDTQYNFSFQVRQTTDIYKFALGEGSPDLVAVGSVPGRILNQYAMGEYNGFLRVATTSTDSATGFVNRGPSNNVFVLEQRGDRLEVAGSIRGLALGEEIRSVRFLGDKGFMVTFERTDPFFTLDLSDPFNPRTAGELKIPGFSTFLTPIDEDHILAVGEYIPEEGPLFSQGVQVSIFDVSDFDNPRRSANVIIGDESTYSEATFDPKAFTYYPERNMVALPISQYSFFTITEDDVVDILPRENFHGLYLFEIGTAMSLAEVGRIQTVSPGDFFAPSFTRGVFIGDDVFAVTDRVVVAAALEDVAGSQVRLELPSPFDDGDIIILEGDEVVEDIDSAAE
ncbi:MAG: beta-propeller domain-containing protein [Planctomycetes bacterium]|nr:beta-propeller domain-containing protein [Planctomycetota bacterium]